MILELISFILIILILAMPNLHVPDLPDFLRGANETSPAADSSPETSPTPDDIVLLRAALHRAKGLPPDIVDCIFDFAEFWARSSSVVNYGSEMRQSKSIVASCPQENTFLLRSPPLGLTHVCRGNIRLAEELVYDSSEARPIPLTREHDAAYFSRLVDYPTPRLVNPCRKIVFSIRSHDQGWGNHDGSYASSWTWFEAGLERFDAAQECDEKCTYDARRDSSTETPPALPVCGIRPVQPTISVLTDQDETRYLYDHPLLPDDRYNICRNKAACRDWQDHVVAWSYLDDVEPTSDAGADLHQKGRGRASADGSFVRGLRLGDVVTVWGKARFPQWINTVDSVRIDVYWAV
ncbi:ankyrin repeat protein [Ophiocordyceps camponoti-floridani]|uniref:Ankyrin repeat protein n=1 Tax=Ophiocordyceps camponoti-floridani TaxID=2030778 RepID=A0A8H4Q5S2_9HYPO|nr:ankyrin repeat protein [Ophiocordyceps camponoti-floridani]